MAGKSSLKIMKCSQKNRGVFCKLQDSTSSLRYAEFRTWCHVLLKQFAVFCNPEHEVLAPSILEVGLPKIGGWHFFSGKLSLYGELFQWP